ncbi:putative d-3-phosphoglycerate dehydrogenase [Phaeomoniella chlamydospora]|uniref:D-3-phosphoglycerate dehydrogenase n=1 Tax=Phaeomoniella chlamydospora TaxID=158046 RepID=A0A0G2E363_PHACM|nr:putative d-3-phosphoglycerate dehydrogenase [Phaeomoniella chlamydospora]
MCARRRWVLVPEKLSPDGLALLRTTLDVDERRGLSAAELRGLIPDYEALLVRSETKVTSELLAAGKRLKVVARAGVGVDNVDVPAATKHGVIVVNSPVGNIGAAAEHTIALLMALARNVPDACLSLKAGKWERSRLVGIEVQKKTLGIIGLGKVGLTVARLAKGLGMTVIAYDPYASPSLAESQSIVLYDTLPLLLPLCDFVTIHTPLLASTRGMLSATELTLMKPGSRVLNVARGGTVDEAALLEALESGHIAGAALDVFTSEPPPFESTVVDRLIAHPRVVATPHLGASTVEAQENVSIDVCEQVLQILAGALPRSAVNAPIILPEEYRKLQPFVELVEKMGSLYTQHYSQSQLTGPRRRTVRNTFTLTYEGVLTSLSTTKPLFAALVKGLLAPISNNDGDGSINVNIVNAELIARERGIVISEQSARDVTSDYSSLVTLTAHPSPATPSAERRTNPFVETKTTTSAGIDEDAHIITGHISSNVPFISRLSHFSTSFVPSGHLLICRNYDSPGRIGLVGSLLGTEGVNINFMSVAAREQTAAPDADSRWAIDPAAENGGPGPEIEATIPSANGNGLVNESEALMILGVDRAVHAELQKQLMASGGVLSVSAVEL